MLFRSAFDIFFLPSRTEALAYVALEALQTNLPIIASDVGGIPEVLSSDPGTKLVDMHNETTRELLREVFSSPVKKIENSARENLREKFSLENMMSKTIETYSR